jgi:hypothetical protein
MRYPPCLLSFKRQRYSWFSMCLRSVVPLGADWEELDRTGKDAIDEISEQPTDLSEGSEQPLELSEAARFHFDKAAEAGDPLALEWLTTVPHAKEEPLLS